MSKIKMPWRADNEDPVYVEDSNGIHIASFQSEEAASRAIACVNACVGIDTELLEIIADNDKTLAGVVAHTEKQRDELLAALKDVVSVAKTAHECWDKDQDSKVGKYLIALSGGLPGYDKRTDEIHRAIASVKGGA